MKTCKEFEDPVFQLRLHMFREHLAQLVMLHKPIDPIIIDEIIINNMWKMWGYKRLMDYLEQELKFSREEAAKKTTWAIVHQFEDEKLYDLDKQSAGTAGAN